MPRPCGTHALGKEAEDVQGEGGQTLSGGRLERSGREQRDNSVGPKIYLHDDYTSITEVAIQCLVMQGHMRFVAAADAIADERTDRQTDGCHGRPEPISRLLASRLHASEVTDHPMSTRLSGREGPMALTLPVFIAEVKFLSNVVRMPSLVSDRATEKPASCMPEENGKKSPPAKTARQDKEPQQQNKKRYAGCSDAGATSQMEIVRTRE
ncbi:hypothetical protein ANN_15444 [Periplaneta americana]|uniref:Uncharacterized protein n=1 Tax=Periplaneta americana TaxID=6978 RepID=A0ABQ8SHI1_PERAM|nr:hypothetical protein ANN_15444 [Periplaneta americana]